jgi:hypothetical protein
MFGGISDSIPLISAREPIEFLMPDMGKAQVWSLPVSHCQDC